MAVNNVINANQVLNTTSNVTFGQLNLVTPLSVVNGGTGSSGLTAFSLILGNGTSPLVALGAATDGQLPIGVTGGAPVLSTLTAGTNMTVTNGPGTISLAVSGTALFGFQTITTTSQAMVVNTGYVVNNASLVTLTLPATAALGSKFIVTGLGAGGWTIVLNSGQSINFGSLSTTVTTGSLSSTNQFDCVTFYCSVANTTFNVTSVIGNITVV